MKCLIFLAVVLTIAVQLSEQKPAPEEDLDRRRRHEGVQEDLDRRGRHQGVEKDLVTEMWHGR